MSDEFRGSWGENSKITVTNMITDENKPACTTVGSAPTVVSGCETEESPDSLEGWVKQEGTNCYEGSGASSVPPGNYGPAEGITAVACMAACGTSAIPCTAIVTNSAGGCWLVTDVDLDSCQEDADFDLWLSPQVPPSPSPSPSPAPAPAPDPDPAPAPSPPPSPQHVFIKSTINNMCLGTDHPWEDAYVTLEMCQSLWSIQDGQLMMYVSSAQGQTQFCAVRQNFWGAEVGCHKHDGFIWFKDCREATNQRWSFDRESGELSVETPSGTFCLDMPLDYNQPHQRVRSQPCGAESQKWSLVSATEDWVTV